MANIKLGTYESAWVGTKPFGLNLPDTFQHIKAIGQTGVGKSTFLLNIFAQVVRMDVGCTLIDFNGDLSQEALSLTPLSRIDDIVYCDPMDTKHVLPINPLYQVPPDERSTFAYNFTEMIENIFHRGHGDRLDWILRNFISAILDAPDHLRPSLLSIPMLLHNKRYRQEATGHIQSPTVRDFFENDFEAWSNTRTQDNVTPVQNRIDKILGNTFIRNALTPHKPNFKFSDAVTKKSILILRLSKGQLGTQPASLFASHAVSSIIQAAYKQAELPYARRIPHVLITDEWQNLKTRAPINALSEGRKYKLSLVSTTQFLNQLDKDLVDSIFGNVGTIVAFRSSADDADILAKQIGRFNPFLFTELGRGEVVVRLMRDGNPTIPFIGKTLSQSFQPHTKAQRIIERVRQRYTKPRETVERDYLHWAKKQAITGQQKRGERKATTKKRKTYWKKRPLPKPIIPDAELRRSQHPEKPLTPREINDRLARARVNLQRHLSTKRPPRRKRGRHRNPLLDA